jgi:hypothetical protein
MSTSPSQQFRPSVLQFNLFTVSPMYLIPNYCKFNSNPFPHSVFHTLVHWLFTPLYWDPPSDRFLALASPRSPTSPVGARALAGDALFPSDHSALPPRGRSGGGTPLLPGGTGQSLLGSSPWLIAAIRVLHRSLAPRH